MIRLVILAATTAMALAGPGIARAAPDETADDPYCSYTLSPPHRDRNGNTDAVIVTLEVEHCNGHANARHQSVCVSLDDGATPLSDCGKGFGWGKAAKAAVPWIPGRTYTATGSGCSDHGIPFNVTFCKPMGPISVTL